MQSITRQQFMDFFRSEDFHYHLSPDDTIEIFLNVLHGQFDLTRKLLTELCDNYSTSLTEVINNTN